MERNCNNSLKDHKIGSKFNSNQNSGNNKMKDSWNYSKSNSQQQQQSCLGEEYLSGFSWPPRSYTCSFCKREFRSAQALGGHMNVHRRDRARLRMSPPPPRDNINNNNNNNNNNNQYPFLNLNISPNPNPNFNSTPPLVSPFSTSFSSQSPTSPSEMNKWGIVGTLGDALSPKDSAEKSSKSFTGAEELDGYNKLTKKAEIVRLDLEIGLFSDSKEDLDLELRLGYS